MLDLVEDVADTMILVEALFPVVNGEEVMFHPVNEAAVRRIIDLMEEVRNQVPLGSCLHFTLML